MATLNAQQVTQAGVLEALVAAGASGDKVAPGGVRWLEFVNTGGATRTVTIDSQRNSDQGTDVNLVVAVATGERRKVGPLDAGRFTNIATGLIEWTYDSNANLNVGAFYI
jgi:hypothetical protein